MTREEAIRLLLVEKSTIIEVDGNKGAEKILQAYDMAIEALKDRHKGEWKPFDLTWGRNVYFCTACKESTEVPTVNGQPSYNYCPNCGAIMKGETDD